MKKSVILGIILFSSIILASAFVSSNRDFCNLQAQLINQDPYPAMPGETVKLLFQISGIETTACNDIIVELNPRYPFSLVQGQEARVRIQGGTYTRNHAGHLMVPYEVYVDSGVIQGNNKIELKYTTDRSMNTFLTREFDIEVRDVTTDFEVFIRDYDSSQKRITFEILNSGKNNIEALTVEIPRQENIVVKGSNRNIVGFLDANDFITTNFEATPKEGNIELVLYYTDLIGERRSFSKSVYFEPDYFEGRLRDEQNLSGMIYIVVVLIAFIVGYYFYKRHQKNKKKKLFD